ncbi:hypothetical protein [Bifidobacterium subtile]|nr:hypothetical protein [Bifidobacterium subtile]
MVYKVTKTTLTLTLIRTGSHDTVL